MLSENFIKTMQDYLPGVEIKQHELNLVGFKIDGNTAMFIIDDLLNEETEIFRQYLFNKYPQCHRIYSAIQSFVETYGKDAIYTA